MYQLTFKLELNVRSRNGCGRIGIFKSHSHNGATDMLSDAIPSRHFSNASSFKITFGFNFSGNTSLVLRS